jgi:uncharacterized repeat protein (TIGR01451 family)
LSQTDWSLPSAGWPGSQAGDLPPDQTSIYLEGGSNINFISNQISHLGGIAYDNQGAEGSSVVRNKIFDIGAGAVKIDYDPQGANIISDNHIYNIGTVFKEGVGIWVKLSGNNLISHNLIYNTNYSGISVGWRWDIADSPAQNNIIEYNEIHNVMQELNDGAGIYLLGKQPGTVVRYNKIHDNLMTSFHLYPRSIQGIYLDEGSSEILVRDNLVYRTQTGGLHLHRAYNNTIENNIFVDGELTQLRFNSGSLPFQTPAGPVDPSLNKFLRNIIYNSNQNSFYATLCNLDNSSLSQSDYNLVFYSVPSPPSTADPTICRNEMLGSCNCFNFTDWRTQFGFDSHSLTLNPLFVNYAQDNFNLQSNSPALSLGFQPPDLSQVGPRAFGVILIKSTDKLATYPNQIINYTIFCSNGEQGVNNVSISDFIPAGTTFMTASNGAVLGGGQIRWDLGNLPSNVLDYVSFQARVD